MKRVAVVTGGYKGIGKAVVQSLQRRGYTTVGLSRPRLDVRSEASVSKAFKSVVRQHKKVDVLVTCAGIAAFSGALKISDKEWSDVMGTNLYGTYYCCKNVLPLMARRRFGRIVTVSSIAGRSFSRSASLSYTCSKYGVIGLTRQLAAEFGKDGVTINCVAPSQTETEMLSKNFSAGELDRMAKSNPLGRLATPAEVANVISFLASNEASYINGAVVDVNGGLI